MYVSAHVSVSVNCRRQKSCSPQQGMRSAREKRLCSFLSLSPWKYFQVKDKNLFVSASTSFVSECLFPVSCCSVADACVDPITRAVWNSLETM